MQYQLCVASIDKERFTPPLRQSRHMHFSSFFIPPSKTQQRQVSFFPRVISDWHRLPQPIVLSRSVETPLSNTYLPNM
jgi:hypothetical protein